MSTPPLGLAYIAGALRQAGMDLQVIDGLGASLDSRHPWDNDSYVVGLDLDELLAAIEGEPALIGVSCNFSFEWPLCRKLIVMLRDRFPDGLIAAGGEHVTALPELSMSESPLDLVIMGEGETTAVEVAEVIASGNRDFSNIPGIAFRSGDGVKINSQRPRIRNIDSIARPAWDLLPINEYLDRHQGFGIDRGRSMPMLASRGCPYQCTFCSSPKMWTTRWIARDPSDVLDEIADYQAAYDARNFDFYDLTAIVKKSWIVEFCNLIKERGMRFTWQLPSGTRSEAIDEEVARLLYNSGCRNISYSPESGSPSVLDRIKKRVKLPRLLDSAEACSKSGISVKFNIIFGFPNETLREVLQSYRFIALMALRGVHDLSIWAFSPYPGSELYDQIYGRPDSNLDDNYYDSLRSYSDISNTKSYSENFSNRQLRILRIVGMVVFYLTSWIRYPQRPFVIAINLFRGRQESRGEMALANLIRFRRLRARSGA